MLKQFHDERLLCGQLGVDFPSLGPLVTSLKRQGCGRTRPLINIPVFYFIRTLENDLGLERGKRVRGVGKREGGINGKRVIVTKCAVSLALLHLPANS